jgi:hypothetical protein
MPNIKHACMSVAVLFPMAAHGSFGGGGGCKDFVCHYLIWGAMLGVMGGIPASVVTFIVLCVAYAHPDRSKGKQVILGGSLGMVVWLIASACAALLALWGKNPWIGFVGIFVVAAISCVLYSRSSPEA